MNLNLNKNQKDKIYRAYKNNKDVTIQLQSNQIDTGKYKFSFDVHQITKLKNAKKNNTGVRLELKHKQIKEGGFLPIIIAGISAASALAGGASAVYSAVTDAQHKKRMEQETIRHNKEMEKIRSQGAGLKEKKKRKN